MATTLEEALTLRDLLMNNPTPFCWNPSSLRGFGLPPTECGEQEAGLLACYPECEAGFAGVGPLCLQECPEGFLDTGLGCYQLGKVQPADVSTCPAEDRCGLWADRECGVCPEGFERAGCLCVDPGESLVKEHKLREPSGEKSCSDGLELASDGFCYAPCADGKEGFGPLCTPACPAGLPVECGSGCAVSADACALTIASQLKVPVQAVANIAAAISSIEWPEHPDFPTPPPAGDGEWQGPAADGGVGSEHWGSSMHEGDAIAAMEVALSDQQKDFLAGMIRTVIKATQPDLPPETVDTIVEILLTAAEGGDVDMSSADPFGLAAVFEAFAFPICSDKVVPAGD